MAKYNIKNCARCDGDHDDLEFSPLDNHIKYTHWASCPTNGQPVLMIVKEDINKNDEILYTTEYVYSKE